MKDVLELTTPLREQLQQRKLEDVKQYLIDMHWADVTRALEELEPSERAIAFQLLDKNKAIEVFEELESEEQESLLEALGLILGVLGGLLACFLGFLLPWILIKLGLDHAPGANPFITTMKDFTSLLVYFSLVAWLIGV